MIETLSLYRPGLTAIAAVLALSSTSVMAQVALPDVAAPAVPTAAAPTAAPATPIQTVQPLPSTPKLPEIAVSETQANPVARAQTVPAARAASTAQTAPRQNARNAEITRAPAVAARTEMKTATVPQNKNKVAPLATATPALVTPASEPKTTRQSRAEAMASNDMGYAGWVLLGGGLLIVAGGAAFALGRRPRRRDGAAVYEVPVAPIMSEPVAIHPQPVTVQPPETTRPALRAIDQDLREPRAIAPHHNIGGGMADDRRDLLEALVAEAPSVANPFHSRRNRLRRADYLLRTGQTRSQAGNLAEAYPSNRELPLISDRWSEMRLAGKQSARVSWKPATTR